MLDSGDAYVSQDRLGATEVRPGGLPLGEIVGNLNLKLIPTK